MVPQWINCTHLTPPALFVAFLEQHHLHSVLIVNYLVLVVA